MFIFHVFLVLVIFLLILWLLLKKSVEFECQLQKHSAAHDTISLFGFWLVSVLQECCRPIISIELIFLSGTGILPYRFFTPKFGVYVNITSTSLKNFFCFFFWLCWVLVVACGIIVHPPGVEPMSPAFRRWIVSHWTTREVPTPPLLLRFSKCSKNYAYPQ